MGLCSSYCSIRMQKFFAVFFIVKKQRNLCQMEELQVGSEYFFVCLRGGK